jgi:hypothetical protein
MRLTFQWRCATCGHAADANPGFCPRCGASAGPPTVAERWNRAHPRDPMLASAGARARKVIQPAPARPRSTRIGQRGRERVWAPFLILSSAAGILLGVTLWATGVFTSGSSRASKRVSTPTPVKSRPVSHPHPAARARGQKPRPPAATAGLGTHRVFAGRAFSVAYPRGWTITAAETPAPWGTDTTISAPGDADTMLRVDVTTNPASSDPITAAEPVIAGVARQPGYRPARPDDRRVQRPPGRAVGVPGRGGREAAAQGGCVLHLAQRQRYRGAHLGPRRRVRKPRRPLHGDAPIARGALTTVRIISGTSAAVIRGATSGSPRRS